MEHPLVTLSNGLRVLNFSSPHPFTFSDGTILPACTPEQSTIGKLDSVEMTVRRHDKFKDITILWKLTPQLVEALFTFNSLKEIDIILVPLPVMVAVKESGIYDVATHFPKMRVIRVVDRLKKTISTDTFCV